MRCTVLLFAHLREAVGTAEVGLELPDGATVGAALDALTAAHPVLAVHRAQTAVAVDEVYRPADFPLPDGCTLALIPPVSGG